jgi:hypothetical protein
MSVDCCSRRSPVAMVLLKCFAVTQLYAPAWAYRPFDGTDAAVADSGEVEIELQPAGLLQEGSQEGSNKTLVAPVTVIADRGDALAQNNIGWLYEKGWGVAQDYAQAMSWYRKAADQGNASAQKNMQRMAPGSPRPSTSTLR